MGRRAHDGLRKRCGCGRGRRKWPRSPHSWHFNFCHDGRAYRFSLDVVARARGEQPPGTMAEASGWRDRIRGEIRAGTLGDPKAIRSPWRRSRPWATSLMPISRNTSVLRVVARLPVISWSGTSRHSGEPRCRLRTADAATRDKAHRRNPHAGCGGDPQRMEATALRSGGSCRC